MDPPIARILDANSNRAREALRVMEDYTRFVLNDPASCAAFKEFRHDLANCLQSLNFECLLASRDTPNDVGTTVSTPSEQYRGDSRDVFIAAAKRLPEALRTLEEYSKVFSSELPAQLEAIRYRAYELEQRVLLRGERSARFARTRLYVILTEALCRGDWLKTAAKAIEGGADCMQLREKDMEDAELISRARELATLCREQEVLFIVNDRPDVAVLSGADGVHLGQTDMSLSEARRIVGPDRLIGISTHTMEQFDTAQQSAPDYVAVGPMFDSATKPQAHIAGPALLQYAAGATSIPIVPIGGIAIERLPALIRAGAQRVCVCSAIIGADDPAQASRQFSQTLTSKKTGQHLLRKPETTG